MNVGKLYQVKKYFWLLYPSKDIAAAATTTTTAAATAAAAYWSKKYNCNVSYISPKSIFVFLEQDGKFCKILSTNGELGWIILSDLCKNNIEEVTV
jgi:hypothetical protein